MMNDELMMRALALGVALMILVSCVLLMVSALA